MGKALLKKIMSIFVIIILVCGTFELPVAYAAAPANMKFTVPTKSAARGENVTISIIINANANVLNGMTVLHYDDTKLQYVSSKAGVALSGSLFEINDKVANQVTIGFISTNNLNASGSVLDVIFKVKDTMSGSTPLTLVVKEWANDDGDSASNAVIVNGAISIAGLTVNVTATNGSIIGKESSYTFGDNVTLAAVPTDGYIFVNWTDKAKNILSTNQIYSFIINDNIELTANFLDRCDINKDGMVTIEDLNILKSNFGKTSKDGDFDKEKDLNSDGVIDIYDLVILSKKIRSNI